MELECERPAFEFMRLRERGRLHYLRSLEGVVRMYVALRVRQPTAIDFRDGRDAKNLQIRADRFIRARIHDGQRQNIVFDGG